MRLLFRGPRYGSVLYGGTAWDCASTIHRMTSTGSHHGTTTISPSGHPNGNRLVAIADVHGDYDRLVEALVKTRLIDDRQRWAAGRSTLVQTGDLIDRGEQDKEVLDFFMRLQDEAKAAGGRVVNLFGNHELMVAEGDLRYQSPVSRRKFAKGDFDIEHGKYGKWIWSTFLPAYIERKVLFVHGFLHPRWLNNGFDALIASAKNKGGALDSLVWTRPTEMRGDEVAALVTQSLQNTNCDYMIVGHCPHHDVKYMADGRLILLDTAWSRWMGGNPAAVAEVTDGHGQKDAKPSITVMKTAAAKR